MKRGAVTVARWLPIVVAVVAGARGLAWAGLPSPYLLAAFVVGIAFALLARSSRTVPASTASAAQAVIGVTAGSYLDRSTIATVGAHLVPILAVSVLTLGLSVAAGLLLARFSRVDRATAAFGMIAGGSSGIISLSRELGADERIVAVMQYMRLLIIVAVTPVVAIGVFGMSRATRALTAGPMWSAHSLVYVTATAILGLILARAVRLPGGTILGPMLAAAALSLVYRPIVAPIPVVVADAAVALIGLDVGLRFTPGALRQAGELLPRTIAAIAAMLVVSAGFGVALAASTNVSMLDGYLATTPGGLSAVIALVVGSRTNISFIVSVQVIRTFLMLAAAPPIARALSSRGGP